ncbi:DNA recombination protein RecF [Noviherbaspirillum denitrificans]|uniref:DNA recombination protein RecF n=1 Tax=Noviherbaspirillum denitrificans TaxID=1968433 RepID=A0A254TKI3_9BURK|nr:DNA recombination protein RecF [Noviherbaspirillum denitrificans]
MSLACCFLSACATVPTTVTNTLGMQMVLLPSGDFMMGNDTPPEDLARLYPQYEPKRLKELTDEAPVHLVRITRPFYIARHEVTVGQFRQFVQASGYTPESVADKTGGYGYNPSYDPATSRRGDAFEGRDSRYSWENPGFVQGDDHPVVNVTWNDAQALVRWLSQTEGRRYRLPTEAEWEYACRAGTRTQYHSGDDPVSLAAVANVFDADAAANWQKWQAFAVPAHDGYAFTAPVGQFAANAFGLHDMHGNVWEWTADWHDDTYYARSPVDDPAGPAEGEVKVRRGGSWHTWPLYARCAYRNWNNPATRYTLVGIRVVMEAPKPEGVPTRD